VVLLVAAAVAAVLAVIADLALGVSSPGLIAATGFLGCAALILGAKWVGKVWLRRDEDYWERVAQRRAALVARPGAPGDGTAGGDGPA